MKIFKSPVAQLNRLAGVLLRHPSIHNPVTGSDWTLSVLFSLVQELVDFWEGDLDSEYRGRGEPR